ncbi:MAG: membrane protein insertion efficiency factor YidD [Chloroflexi bacterium]|nr:MAG: membrane protein insertion efficiency factor YidD [Chloroflexota bacterium]
MRPVALGAIRFYQRFISASWPAACKYQPTCSHYGHEAISRHGVFKGIWLTAWRLVRCNPFNSGGYDPVP